VSGAANAAHVQAQRWNGEGAGTGSSTVSGTWLVTAGRA